MKERKNNKTKKGEKINKNKILSFLENVKPSLKSNIISFELYQELQLSSLTHVHTRPLRGGTRIINEINSRHLHCGGPYMSASKFK